MNYLTRDQAELTLSTKKMGHLRAIYTNSAKNMPVSSPAASRSKHFIHFSPQNKTLHGKISYQLTDAAYPVKNNAAKEFLT